MKYDKDTAIEIAKEILRLPCDKDTHVVKSDDIKALIEKILENAGVDDSDVDAANKRTEEGKKRAETPFGSFEDFLKEMTGEAKEQKPGSQNPEDLKKALKGVMGLLGGLGGALGKLDTSKTGGANFEDVLKKAMSGTKNDPDEMNKAAADVLNKLFGAASTNNEKDAVKMCDDIFGEFFGKVNQEDGNKVVARMNELMEGKDPNDKAYVEKIAKQARDEILKKE